MALTINIYYTGEQGAAKKFVDDMIENHIVDRIRAEQGNNRYDYFFPMADDNTVLLIDEWESEEALDYHHKSPMMKEIADLRRKYRLSMTVKKFKEID